MMNTRGYRWTAILLAMCCVMLLTVSSGVVAGKKKKKKETKPTVERKSFQLVRPSIELESVEGYPAVQDIGGVRVELTRVPFEQTPMYTVIVQERTTKAESWTGIRFGTAIPVYVGMLPSYEINPKNVQFKIRITNQLGGILRLSGAALLFVRDGETLETQYEQNELEKVMILPGKSWEGTLQGPGLEAFGLKEFSANTATGDLLESAETASEGVFMVGLYDIITEFDAARNPTKRSNFEWAYAYKASSVPENAEAVRWATKMQPDQIKAIQGDHPADEVAAMIPAE